MVPYHRKHAFGLCGVRAELLRSLLEEFAIFRVFKPVQLNVQMTGDGQNVDFDWASVSVRNDEADLNSEQQDDQLFSELHSLLIEDDVETVLTCSSHGGRTLR